MINVRQLVESLILFSLYFLSIYVSVLQMFVNSKTEVNRDNFIQKKKTLVVLDSYKCVKVQLKNLLTGPVTK